MSEPAPPEPVLCGPCHRAGLEEHDPCGNEKCECALCDPTTTPYRIFSWTDPNGPDYGRAEKYVIATDWKEAQKILPGKVFKKDLQDMGPFLLKPQVVAEFEFEA